MYSTPDIQSSSPTRNASGKTKVIFLHHSTGANLIKQGRLRELLAHLDPNIEFWDHGYELKGVRRTLAALVKPYSDTGLWDGQGHLHLRTFGIPNDNTNPDGWRQLFTQPLTPESALAQVLQFDVILFKSCFPVSRIEDEAQLEQYKADYLAIREVFDTHRNKLFIPMTPPPLRAGMTTPEQAERARRFARWMASEEFHGNRANVVVYDLFDVLAVPEDQPRGNTLNTRYCRTDTTDSHPNALANREAAPRLASFLVTTIQRASFLNG